MALENIRRMRLYYKQGIFGGSQKYYRKKSQIQTNRSANMNLNATAWLTSSVISLFPSALSFLLISCCVTVIVSDEDFEAPHCETVPISLLQPML
jgi:hypothetical protein